MSVEKSFRETLLVLELYWFKNPTGTSTLPVQEPYWLQNPNASGTLLAPEFTCFIKWVQKFWTRTLSVPASSKTLLFPTMGYGMQR